MQVGAGLRDAMIRVGIGGWVFKSWRDTFHPEGLQQARELEHAERSDALRPRSGPDGNASAI